MAKALVIATLIGVVILMPGCSSEVAKVSNQTAVNSNSSVPAATPAPVNSESANTGGNVANTAPVIAIDPGNVNKKGQLRESSLPSVSGVDDSAFTSTMDKDGNFVEIRTFKNDPMLVKVERKVLGRTSKYFVYLKGGKVVEASAETMSNFRVLSPGNILQAIGLKPTQPKVPLKPTQKKEE